MKFELNEYAILNDKVERDLPTHSGDLVTISRIITSSPNFQYDVELPNGDYSPVRECELNKLTDRKKELITYVKVGHHVEYIPTHEVVLILKTDFLHEMAEVEFEDAGIQVVRMIALRKIEKEVDSVTGFKFKVGDNVKFKTNDQYNNFIGMVVKTILTDDGNKEYKVELENKNECFFSEMELDFVKESKTDEDKLGYFAELGLEVGKLVDEKQKAYGDSVTKCYEIMKVLLQDYHNEENHTYTIPESLLEIMLLDVRKIDKLNRRFSNPNGDLMSENPFKDDVGYSLLGMRTVESVKKAFPTLNETGIVTRK